MLTSETKVQFNEIFEELAKNLDISETDYKNAVKSYQAVGGWLADNNSSLSLYKPEILPQGSFLLGTMVKPVNENDELDVDVVCRLEGKNANWAQYHLKNAIGDRLKDNGTYKEMLRNREGRRCWTLHYADSSKYHMDILPSIVSKGYKEILEKAYSSLEFQDFNQTAIRITDKFEENYYVDTNPNNWQKSNPFGYAIWFQQKCSLSIVKSLFLSESINPIPTYNNEKLPLQRVVQLLKRHRDIMFNGHEDKPISIIITTLSSKAYQKETDIISALNSVVSRMESFIEERYSEKHDQIVKWIANPINPEENFADKWAENPQKEQNFYEWMRRIKSDLSKAYELRGIHNIEESFSKSFGENVTKSSFVNLADKVYNQRESGSLFMKQGTGILGAKIADSTIVKSHTFHGEGEK